jgi:hypothetical protein
MVANSAKILSHTHSTGAHMLIRLASTLILALTIAAPAAHAGIIEDLLSKPAIQALLGRLPDVQSTIKSCADARYQQRNVKLCQEAAEAARVASVPADLRAVLATPNGSASIRQLCLAAQGTPVQESYLCAELAKADPPFKAQLEQQRIVAAQEKAIQVQRAIGAGAEQSR